MIQGIYHSAAAADALQMWNDAIARNIASSTTPGFRKDTVSFDGVASGVMAFGADPNRPIERAGVSPRMSGAVDFQAGEVRQSGDPHEFAINGAGFFRLQRPDGGHVYTRDGQFRVSPEGQLVSKQGYAVTGDGGPIQLLSDGGPISIDAEGRVRQGDQDVGALTIYRFDDPTVLQRAIGGFVVDPASEEQPQIATGSRVRQGFLESSNVSAVREMVDMITVSNSLQANQKVIQTLDTAMERAIQLLGPSGL